MKSRTVTGGSMTYTYDAGGTMVKRTNADGSSTVYIGGIFEKNFNASGIATGTTKYYAALGRTIAVRTETSGGAGTLTYLLADHLGTTVGTLDASGNVVSTQKYWPYGATRSTSTITQTDKLYTGQQQELGDALGLYNYKARMYSTVTGRFVSADPVAADGLNRYAYVLNSPLSNTDPRGLCIWDLKCTLDAASNFLTCALGTNCDTSHASFDDMLRMSVWAIQQNSFWGNVFDAFSRDEFDTPFVGRLVFAITKVKSSRFGLLPNRAFETVGQDMLGLSARFFKDSLQDLLLGGNRLADENPDDVIRAYPWWALLTDAFVLLGPAFEHNSDAERVHYHDATMHAAAAKNAEGWLAGTGLNGLPPWLPWSNDQRVLLHRDYSARLTVPEASVCQYQPVQCANKARDVDKIGR